MPVTFRRKDNLKPDKTERLIGQAVKQGLQPLGNQIVQHLKAQSPKDRGGFRAGIKKRIEGSGLRTVMIIYNDSPHAVFVERGRGPGKQPPPAVIQGWVRRKGLGRSASTRKVRSRVTGRLRSALKSSQSSIAFLIGRAIGRRGIKGKFLFRDVTRVFASQIRRTQDLIESRIARLLNS